MTHAFFAGIETESETDVLFGMHSEAFFFGLSGSIHFAILISFQNQKHYIFNKHVFINLFFFKKKDSS